MKYKARKYDYKVIGLVCRESDGDFKRGRTYIAKLFNNGKISILYDEPGINNETTYDEDFIRKHFYSRDRQIF